MTDLRIGLISDTHGLLRPEAREMLAGVRHILHAGDIGRPEVIAELETIAPVTAIRGNNDDGAWAKRIPDTETVALGGVSIYLLHDVKLLDIDPSTRNISVVVSGHSHRPLVAWKGGVLFVNPGSAGPRRFRLPLSVGFLDVGTDGTCHAEIRPLALRA